MGPGFHPIWVQKAYIYIVWTGIIANEGKDHPFAKIFLPIITLKKVIVNKYEKKRIYFDLFLKKCAENAIRF